MEGKCEKHPEANTIGKCTCCGKPICTECVKFFGYFCSMRCQYDVKEKTEPAITPETKEKVKEIKKEARLSTFLVLKVLPLVLIAAIGLYVYFTFFSGVGKPAWSSESEKTTISVLSSGKTLILSHSDSISALNQKTGEKLWEHPLKKGRIHHIRLLPQKNAICIIHAQHIVTINAENGKAIQKTSLPAQIWSDPYFSTDNVFFYLNETKNYDKPQFRLYSYSLPDLKKNWQIKLDDRPNKLLHAHNLLFLVFCKDPQFTFIKCDEHATTKDFRNITNCESCQYVKEKDASIRVVVLNSASHKKLWEINYESEIVPYIIPLEKDFIFDSGKKLYRISDSGKVVWKLSVDRGSLGSYYFGMIKEQRFSIQEDSQNIYIFEDDSTLSLYDLKTGTKKKSITLDTRINSFIIDRDKLYYIYNKPVESSPGAHPAIAAIAEQPTRSYLKAFSLKKEKTLWETKHVRGNLHLKNNRLFAFYTNMSINLLDDEKLFADRTRIQCFNPRSGKQRWVFREDGAIGSYDFSQSMLFILTVEEFTCTPLPFGGTGAPTKYHVYGIKT